MKKGLIGIAVLAIIVAGYFVFFNSDDSNENAMENNEMVNDHQNSMDNDDMDKEDMDKEDMDKDDMDKDDMDKDDMDKDDMDKDDMDKDDMTMKNEGNMAPEFELMSLEDEMVSLDMLKGEKVYVKFWASWCSICLSGLGELDALSQSEDITVYTIVAPGHNGEQDKDDFISWFEGLGYNNIKVLFDETGDIQKDYGVRGFPSSAYIGSDGVLVKFMPGHVSNEMVLEAFNDIY